MLILMLKKKNKKKKKKDQKEGIKERKSNERGRSYLKALIDVLAFTLKCNVPICEYMHLETWTSSHRYKVYQKLLREISSHKKKERRVKGGYQENSDIS